MILKKDAKKEKYKVKNMNFQFIYKNLKFCAKSDKFDADTRSCVRDI